MAEIGPGIVGANWTDIEIELERGRFYFVLLGGEDLVRVGRMEGWRDQRPIFSFAEGDRPLHRPVDPADHDDPGRRTARIVGETIDPTSDWGGPLC